MSKKYIIELIDNAELIFRKLILFVLYVGDISMKKPSCSIRRQFSNFSNSVYHFDVIDSP